MITKGGFTMVQFRKRVLGITVLLVATAGVVAWVQSNPPQKVVRFYLPGPLGNERVPASKLTPLAGDASVGFASRHIGLRTAEEQAWGRHNGLTDSLPFSHALDRVFPPELYETQPNFFPLADGTRFRPTRGNYYWNPDLGREDVAHHAAEEARRYFSANPAAISFGLGVNDGLVFGESPETLALIQPARWFRGRPDYSSLVFTFMNRAATTLARSHPDKYLGALAYYWCENVPPFPVHPQVIPFLTADRSQSYDLVFREEEFSLQRAWAAALGAKGSTGPTTATPPATSNAGANPRLGLYDYLNGYGFLVPRVPIRAFAEHLKHAQAVGFTDYYGESNRNWGIDGPYPWIIAQLLQNPGLSVDGLLDEYYTHYFQSAASPMRRFFERCEEQWMRQSGPSYWLKFYRNEAQAVLFPEDVLVELRGLLEAARDRAGRGIIAQRVALVADAFGVTERLVRFHQARDRVARAVLTDAPAGTERAPGLAEALAAYRARRSDFIRYTVSLTHREPLAFYPINYDDWLRNDPTFAATEALQAPPKRLDAGLERLPGGDFAGPLRPGRRIAGLQYGVDLPGAWQSRLEPTEHGTARLEDSAGADAAGGGRILRLSAQVNATVFQWLPATAGRQYAASVRVRGRISPSDAVMLTLGYLDAQQRPLGKPKVIRVPDGDWPNWVTLQQGQQAPEKAAWVGIAIRVQNQIGEDWAEFREFSLRETVD